MVDSLRPFGHGYGLGAAPLLSDNQTSAATPRRQIQAVIFDMDGVITDSEPLYAEALNVVLLHTGHVLTEKDHAAIMGSSIDETLRYVIQRFQLNGGVDKWTAAYSSAVEGVLSAKAEPTTGIYELLDALRDRGLRIGLASSSRQRWVKAVLTKLGLEGRFTAVAACEMVPEAKPAPDLYLLAARTLGVPPAACIALEDSPRGIRAGKAAGMLTIALRTGPTAGMDISAADHIIDTLGDFPLAWL